MTLSAATEARLERARVALDGLSVGDAAGETFFVDDREVQRRIAAREIGARPPWRWTDDTAMAAGIVEVLTTHGEVDCDALATVFARNYEIDWHRGYGGTAHGILRAIGAGIPWERATSDVFGGDGSMGNGGGMRSAVVGAYFADDPERVVAEAIKSAVVTHAHPEGQAGAVVVALAAAYAWQHFGSPDQAVRAGLLDYVIDHSPSSDVRDGVDRARNLGLDFSVQSAARILGSGYGVIATDTCPFAVWCAACCLGDYEAAFWHTVAGLGDRDTTCAMVGGIVVGSTGRVGIPVDWLEAREPLTHAFPRG